MKKVLIPRSLISWLFSYLVLLCLQSSLLPIPIMFSGQNVKLIVSVYGSNTLGTMKICSRQGKFELMNVDQLIAPGRVRRHNRDIFSICLT